MTALTRRSAFCLGVSPPLPFFEEKEEDPKSLRKTEGIRKFISMFPSHRMTILGEDDDDDDDDDPGDEVPS